MGAFRSRASLLVCVWALTSCAEDSGDGRDAGAPRDVGRAEAAQGSEGSVDTDGGDEAAKPADTGTTDEPGDDTATADAPADDVVVPPMDAVVSDVVAPPMDVVAPDVRPDVVVRDVTPDVRTGPLMVDRLRGSLPATTPSRFAGTMTTTSAPAIVYPDDGTILPSNLPSFEVHFMPVAGATVYQVSFEAGANYARFYTGCTAVGGGCVLTLTAADMDDVAVVSRPGGSLRLTVAAVLDASGAVGRSAARTLGMPSLPINGGVYFWNTGASSIMRYDFGVPTATVERYLAGDPINCVGCHVLSRGGERMMAGRGIPGPANAQVIDVLSRGARGGFGANFGAFSPDATLLLASDGANIGLVDGATGALRSVLTRGTQPDWSPSGSQVIFALPRSAPPIASPGHSGATDLRLAPWTGTTIGGATNLVTSAGENNYYPSFSPDGQFVLFNRSAMDSYDAPDAHLYAVRTSGGAPSRLASADGAGDQGNSWPRWAPFQQTWMGAPLFWFTFSSRRDYGLRLRQSAMTHANQTAQLWMAAFIPGRTGDASAPAFWVPFQDLRSGNHIAQWANGVPRVSCGAGVSCAPGERCVQDNSLNYVCVP